MPQIEPADPKCTLGFQRHVGLVQPSALEWHQCSEDRGEVIVQSEMRRVCIRVQKDGSCITRFLHQPCHVVRKTLRVPDFETKVSWRLKVLAVTAHRRTRSQSMIPQILL